MTLPLDDTPHASGIILPIMSNIVHIEVALKRGRVSIPYLSAAASVGADHGEQVRLLP
jgi:hypothetical protein